MDQIGRYEVKGELGRGGFGVVYRAYDPAMRRSVAIKVLSSVTDPGLLGRFRAEAGVTLQHKNIITIHDFAESGGQPYLVMEFLEGKTLKEMIVAAAPCRCWIERPSCSRWRRACSTLTPKASSTVTSSRPT